MPSEDPVEEMAVGETRTISGETTFDTHEAMWDEFVGFDRNVGDVRVETAFVQDNDVVVQIAGDGTTRRPTRWTCRISGCSERTASRGTQLPSGFGEIVTDSIPQLGRSTAEE